MCCEPPTEAVHLKGVRVAAFVAVVPAPVRVEVVQTGRDGVGVSVPSAEDDGLLFWPASGEKVREEVIAHGVDAVGELDLVLRRDTAGRLSAYRKKNASRPGGLNRVAWK